jgi:hypothetical protein
LEGIAISRGRSTATKVNPESLTFTRPSSLTSRSASANRPPGTAPPYLDTFQPSSRSRSRRRETDSPGTKRLPVEVESHSPTTRLSTGSWSRNSPGKDFGGYEYRGELDVVDEEGREVRGRKGRDGLVPGSARDGRSRSRKRLDV